ncbi:Sensory box histidine kinase [hydrothermal vent metagenome]|uniref:histidine kinase n=1 Tax=hydrothermal vent metagenome TaxID=652676 RepID=A0A3B1B548_9ZZZZ
MSLLTGLDRRKLRLWLLLFFMALVIPTVVLVQQAYSQLKWEAMHQYRVLAEELAARVDASFTMLIDKEEARSFADYAFLVIEGETKANFLQRSPLSKYPVESSLPGLIGYFQVDAGGLFSTPLLPMASVPVASYGISPEEMEQRQVLQTTIQQILAQNSLVDSRKSRLAKAELPEANLLASTAMEAVAVPESKDDAVAMVAESMPLQEEEQMVGQALFDQLNSEPASMQRKGKPVSDLGRVEDLELDYRYQSGAKKSLAKTRSVRKELSVVPMAPAVDAVAARVSIATFESEIDPFEFALLDSGHFVLFRKVWRNGQRYIQGFLLEQTQFLSAIKDGFDETALSAMSNLIVAYKGDVFAAFSGQASERYLSSRDELTGTLLYQTSLSAPLGDLELLFNIIRLPSGAGGGVITWMAAILLLVLCCGLLLMYRLAIRQMELSRQQQDFVSAVSHELKTPLTSIRMYGEMLKEGWASEEKKQTYYDYIYDESERLSRLINNVLQLARMTRSELQIDLTPVTAAELMDSIRSKISSQVERAGYILNLTYDEKAATIAIDKDYFIQIIINLVDNAIKFSANADKKVVDISCHVLQDNSVQFAIRDYGPGIPRDQMKKIFKLFYRSENELTRETVGTGIGLALVHQLTAAMGGRVDVVNKDAGAEFQIFFRP